MKSPTEQNKSIDWKCHIGWHHYEAWEPVTVETHKYMCFKIYTQKRYCTKCNKLQIRNFSVL